MERTFTVPFWSLFVFALRHIRDTVKTRRGRNEIISLVCFHVFTHSRTERKATAKPEITTLFHEMKICSEHEITLRTSSLLWRTYLYWIIIMWRDI